MDAIFLVATLAGPAFWIGIGIMLIGGASLGASMVGSGKHRKERIKMAVFCLISGGFFLTMGSLMKLGIIDDLPPKNQAPPMPEN